MPIVNSWDADDPSIIYTKFSGNWTWQDYNRSSDRIFTMAGQKEHRVDMITDLYDSKGLPKGLATPHIRYFREHKPQNFHLTIIVGSDVYIEGILSLFDRIYGQKFARSEYAQSLEEAKLMIYGQRRKMSIPIIS